MSDEFERARPTDDDGALALVGQHPFVVGFVVFEVALFAVGMGLGIVADKTPLGNTGLIHVAGLVGAFATLMAALAVLTGLCYAGYRLYRNAARA